ncbi:MAG: ComEC/Rec2 family competence protein, partial [Chloroflexi bacterium]|nr:ComEC/Rec2 family competence protein [Chloroflexota bacterium]
LPANLLVAPLFPLIFLGSLATSLAGAVGAGLGTVVGWLLAWLPLSWFVAVGEGAASLPFASAQIDGFGLGHAVVLYAAIFGVAAWLRRGRAERRREDKRSDETPPAARALRALEFPTAAAALLALLAANAVVWGAVVSDDADTLDTHVLDIGQGDAILAVAPGGTTMLVDGGADGQRLLGELAEALPPGHRRLDVVVVTHPDGDHVAGLFAALERYRVGMLLVSPLHDTRELGRQLREEAEAQGIPVRVASAGMHLALGEDVQADVLAPAGEEFGGGVNEASVVMRLRHGSVALLLTGDIDAAGELRLARGPWDLRSQALKVAHHGSKTSTTDLLLRRVAPQVSAISAGADNTFGHPHPGVLERLGVATVLRTDVDGRLRLRSDGETLRWESEH